MEGGIFNESTHIRTSLKLFISFMYKQPLSAHKISS